ncbi:sensor histidine kinase [Taklimakanibacter deserti]|uniref:sensor histidine kinase n=1 Tax=Taklimakanibacter deserti TaxID=2267839 RepID=UPI000E653A64
MNKSLPRSGSPEADEIDLRIAEISRLDPDQYRDVLDALPCAVYITDPDGRIVYFNKAAADLWGVEPEIGKSEFCGSWRLFWPDGRPLPHDECPMALALKEKRPNRGMEAVAERPDGIRIPFIAYPTPIYDFAGEMTGAVNMLVDITDRKRAELNTQRLVAIVENSDDAIISKDLNGVITSWNAGAERLFGYTAEEVIGESVTMLIPPDYLDEEPEILERVRRGDRIDHYETVRRRKDGTLVDISLTVSPIKIRDGRIVGASKIARDISERKRQQEQQALLQREMKHRIKNTIATVQSIASQTLESIAPEERKAFAARLEALANAQDLVTLENWRRASLDRVVERALQPFRETYGTRIATDCPGVWMSAERALVLSLVLHELATNAVKYGALSNDAGTLRIEWLPDEGDVKSGSLRWMEAGGPPVQAPARKGFGSRLVERALGGDGEISFEFRPMGLFFSVRLRLE